MQLDERTFSTELNVCSLRQPYFSTHACGFFRLTIALMLPAICIFGCGKGSHLVRVQGHASYRGEPIGLGAVTFFPVAGRPLTAALSEQGDYQTDLPPGEYTVVVNLGFTPPPGFKEGDPMPKPKMVLPDQYTTRAKSTLTASVKPGQDQPINFELK